MTNLKNQMMISLAGFCAAVWLVAAINPADREAWLLENILLVLGVLLLFLGRRLFQFSEAAYVFISLFVLLHVLGAHYTYSRMPLGLWLRDAFRLARNPYDRVTHFAFGFLLLFPMRELLLRFSGIRRGWSFWLAAAVILAASSLFEILEPIVAETVAPGAGVNWLGGQGDEWDAQNDMLSAFLGSILMMALLALAERDKWRS